MYSTSFFEPPQHSFLYRTQLNDEGAIQHFPNVAPFRFDPIVESTTFTLKPADSPTPFGSRLYDSTFEKRMEEASRLRWLQSQSLKNLDIPSLPSRLPHPNIENDAHEGCSAISTTPGAIVSPHQVQLWVVIRLHDLFAEGWYFSRATTLQTASINCFWKRYEINCHLWYPWSNWYFLNSSFPNASWLSLRIVIGIQWLKRWQMISWPKASRLSIWWMKF
jgi:hypothetical protein